MCTYDKDYSIFKRYPGGDLNVIRNAVVGGIKSIKMWEEGVAQGVSKCIILNLKCAGRVRGGSTKLNCGGRYPQKSSASPPPSALLKME